MSEVACALLWRLTPGRIFRRRAFAAAKAMTANSSFYALRNVRQTSPSLNAFSAVQAGDLRLKATVPSNRQSLSARYMRPGSSKALNPSSLIPIVFTLPDGNRQSFRKNLSICDEKIKFFVKNSGLPLPEADSFAYCRPDLKLSNYDKNKIHRPEP